MKIARSHIDVATETKSQRNIVRAAMHARAKENGIKLRSQCISPTRTRFFGEHAKLAALGLKE